jgi:hypothetical protein
MKINQVKNIVYHSRKICLRRRKATTDAWLAMKKVGIKIIRLTKVYQKIETQVFKERPNSEILKIIFGSFFLVYFFMFYVNLLIGSYIKF